MMRRTQQGITLIEVLVALVILSIAILAHSRMQIMGIRANTDSGARTQVATELTRLAEAIRTNRAASSADYTGTYNSCSTPAKACRSVASGVSCTTAELAAEDLSRHICALRDAVPTAQTVVAWDAATSSYILTATWDSLRSDGSVGNETFRMRFMP